MSTDFSPDYQLSDQQKNVHVGEWDNELDPVLTTGSGDVVRFECRDAANGHFDHNSTVEDLATKPTSGHPLTGPVYVKDAQPGDTLVVDFLDFQHKGFGVSYFYQGEEQKGLLYEEFDDPGLYTWELMEDEGQFVDGIEVPLNPFPGIAGVAPKDSGTHSTIPPRAVGGNLDIKHLTVGSRLYLPIEVEGALFSIGDCHAAQGDGEVCVTGIEAPMFVTARLSVDSDVNIQQPQFETTGPFNNTTESNELVYATTGISDSLTEAAKLAVRHMITHLGEEHGLSPDQAYILTSSICDLKINQVVNKPNWTVSAYIPKSIFPK